MRFLHNLKRGIRNIIYWLPVIWRDRNWDYSFFLEILKHKLEAIHASSFYWGWVGHEKATEEIEQAISLIDSISEYEYAWKEGNKGEIGTLFDIIKDNLQSWWD